MVHTGEDYSKKPNDNKVETATGEYKNAGPAKKLGKKALDESAAKVRPGYKQPEASEDKGKKEKMDPLETVTEKSLSEELEKNISNIADLHAEQQFFALEIGSTMEKIFKGMSGDQTPFNKAQQEFAVKLFSKVLSRLSEDQQTITNSLRGDEVLAHLQSENSKRRKLLTFGIAWLVTKRVDAGTKESYAQMMDALFDYAFSASIDSKRSDTEKERSREQIRICKSLYTMLIVSDSTREQVGEYFKEHDLISTTKQEQLGITEEKPTGTPEASAETDHTGSPNASPDLLTQDRAVAYVPERARSEGAEEGTNRGGRNNQG